MLATLEYFKSEFRKFWNAMGEAQWTVAQLDIGFQSLFTTCARLAGTPEEHEQATQWFEVAMLQWERVKPYRMLTEIRAERAAQKGNR